MAWARETLEEIHTLTVEPSPVLPFSKDRLGY